MAAQVGTYTAWQPVLMVSRFDPHHRVTSERPADADWAVAVVWSRKNPEPWQTVGPNENIKLMSGTHKFDKR